EKSRPVDEIIREIEMLDKNIYKEVMLLGQNVNSYSYGFEKLLKEVSKVEGLLRVRFMTSHPKDMTPQIIGAVARDKKICEAFHLPLQSG
ncbi:MAG: tRNA (N6-isopentenyl adenosine(37)-C2)-methylthiotransferase MiaB, partial [Candidatus Margulisiibacteriota bacterium]